MSERNDDRYVEDSSIAFAMYCDTNDLTLTERRALAESIGSELESAADDAQFQGGVRP